MTSGLVILSFGGLHGLQKAVTAVPGIWNMSKCRLGPERGGRHIISTDLRDLKPVSPCVR